MSAEKQKLYRERKRRNDYLSNDFFVTRCLNDAKLLGNYDEMLDLISFSYDIGGEKLTQRLCLEVYSFTQLALMVRWQISVGRKAIEAPQ